jgi:hypothetical protein
MSQLGKIACFSASIREELNHRLFNGENGKHLIAWLNNLPDVRASISSEFAGKPVSKNNLSYWRKTGYELWKEARERREMTAWLLRESPEMPEAEQQALSKRINAIFIGDILMQLRRMDAMREGPRKSRLQRDLLNRFVALQDSRHNGERLRLQNKRMDFDRRREKHRKAREVPDN